MKARDLRMDGKRTLIITFGRDHASNAYPLPGSAEEQEAHVAALPLTRPIRFNGKMFPTGLPTTVGRGQRYIYFYWSARQSWYKFQVPLDISRILTYAFSPGTEL
jgi:hypothetical protein